VKWLANFTRSFTIELPSFPRRKGTAKVKQKTTQKIFWPSWWDTMWTQQFPSDPTASC